jgi:hypothetical protein
MTDKLTSTNLSGELLDITITSMNNPYGIEKVWYSMHYGIYLPLTKYIGELSEIGEITSDDKTTKRKLRLQFLRYCEHDNILEDFFKVLLCWLNGGGDKKGPYIPGEYNFSQYYQQKLILTVSGGNIITIFAKLLQNISFVATRQTYRDSTELYTYLTTTNQQILTELENKTGSEMTKFQILEHIKNKLDSHKLLASIYNLLEITSYSDFDFNLLPNKDPDTKYMSSDEALKHISDIYKTLEGDVYQSKELKTTQGFTLFRVKSSVMCELDKPDLDQTLKSQKNNCYDAKKAGVISQDLIDRLMPQLINREDRNIHGLQDSNWNLCKQYIEHLLVKKQKIAIATKFNVYTAIGYISEKIKSKELANGKFSIGKDDLELESIIYYINYNTYHLNEVIKKWENGNLKSSRGGIVSKPYLEVCQSFISLDTIINSSYLLSIIGSIIAQYLNFSDSHTIPKSLPLSEKILEKIERDIKQSGIIECQSAKMLPSKITLVNSTSIKEFGAVMKRDLKQPLQTLRFSDVGFPDGINIVLNIISPDIPKPTPSTSLEELFDGLNIYRVEGPDDLVKRGGKKKSKKTRKIYKKNRKTKKYNLKKIKKQNKTRKTK